MKPIVQLAALLCFALLGACATTTSLPEPVRVEPGGGSGPSTTPLQCPPPQALPSCPKIGEPSKPEPLAAPFRSAQWSDLPDWNRDDPTQVWPSLLASCKAMRQPETKAAWAGFCDAALALTAKAGAAQMRALLESMLQPWQVVNENGSVEGLITGYYEPLLRGSRWKSARFPVPAHAVPDDLLVLDLGEVYPEVKTLRLRGRLEGRKVLPYWSRAQIDAQGERFPGKPLLWLADPVEFFFLQVQGSGQVELADGSRVRLAYAEQNGHPYKSIGKWLVDRGELKVEQASLQGIQAWARANPQRLAELLNANPSYVFFREEPASTDGPKGSLGVPLVAGRAVAVDPRTIPLGTPVFLATTKPDGAALNRLVAAQDTGGAIRGRVRADFFAGFGADAGTLAGRMRQSGRLWVLWPRNGAPPQGVAGS